MIGEVIKKKGDKGSGGGADSFKPGVTYVCLKAQRIEMRNIASKKWEFAADEMLLTAELNDRVQKPYYHLVLTWHEHEKPGDEKMVQALDYVIKSLALDKHQIVLGTHHDTQMQHIHAIINRVHPITGKVWSKSNDHARIEKACREIELTQGWSHDRGRFDFVVSEDGTVILKPNLVVWEKKTADRAAGRRAKSSGARKFEKSIGFETFEHCIPETLKARVAEAVAGSYDWQTFHTALAEIGLRYQKAGSGARINILGSEEFAKASAFGSKFSIGNREKSFGPFEKPEIVYVNNLKDRHEDVLSISGYAFNEDIRATEASSFKMTLLRRIYCDIHLDPIVSEAIQYVDLQDIPPQITFKDRSTVVDHGSRVSASKSTKETRATMIAMVKAKGWSVVKPSGDAEFVWLSSLEAARAGLGVYCVPAVIQAQCDAILERVRRQEKIDAEASAATKASQKIIAERDPLIDENNEERAEAVTRHDKATAEAQTVIAALGAGRDPVRTALRTVMRKEEKRIKAELPDRRKVSKPQASSDTDKGNRGRIRRIAKAIRENDASELDRMREVHIDVIATRGGWSYDPKHKDNQNDPQGQERRTYVRTSETIIATKKGPIWVWTDIKSGESGSVVDLWLLDNTGSALRDARKAFREIVGTDTFFPMPLASGPQKAELCDHTHARRRWEEAPYIGEYRTYAEVRGISRATLKRFSNQVRSGAFGGIYFAHRNIKTNDIQGFEQRWEKGGTANCKCWRYSPQKRWMNFPQFGAEIDVQGGMPP